MFRLFGFLILLCANYAQASVPEPSFIVTGQVLSSSQQIKQEGMVITATLAGNHLQEFTLSSSNNFTFALEIPLEASIGPRDIYKARVGDAITLSIAGEAVANVQVSDRGASVVQNVNLPDNFDTDGDGIFDALEIANGTNPNDPNDPVQYGNLDLDGDGITNGAEFVMGTYDPNGDYDRDGFSNSDEYALGTNPNSADKTPLVAAAPGQYAPVNPVGAGLEYLKDAAGNRLTWDEATHGAPTSFQFAYWNVDALIDLLVATDQGKFFVLTQIEDDKFNSPVLTSLFSLPAGSPVQIGFANFDGLYSAELWAFSKANNTVYLYQRNPSGQPYGQTVWTSVALPTILGHVNFGDVNSDGAIDLLVSGIDMSTSSSFTPANTIALYKGSWDGYLPSFSTPTVLTQQSYINNSQIQLLPNIGEAGFDKGSDLLIRKDSKVPVINTSFNGLDAAGDGQRLAFGGVFVESYNNTSEIGIFAGAHSNLYSDPFAYANIDENESNGLADFVFYTGDYGSSAFQFRVFRGIPNTRDSDGDGIPDFKDIDKNDPNKPLPNGNVDYDQDGVPYAADLNHSGLEDADGDGINDAFEIKNGLDPNNAADKNADPDNDGVSNYQEFIDGTDPRSGSSVATQNARMLTSVRSFEGGVSDMVLIGNQELAVSSQTNRAVKLFKLGNLSEVRTIETTDQNGVAKMLQTGNQLILGNVSGAVEVWDVNSGSMLAAFTNSQSSVTDMAIEGVNLFVVHADGKLYQYNIQTLAYVGNWKIYEGFLTSVLVRNDVLYIQASNPEKIMFVWNAQNQELIYTINGTAECCEKVVAELSGETLILANSYSGSGVYATNIGNLNSENVVPNIDVSTVRSINNDIYVGRKSGVIERYSAHDGSFQGRMAAPHSQVRKIELINGGFVSMHADGNIYFWENSK